MAWKQLQCPYPDGFAQVEDAFEAWFLAKGGPRATALFFRDCTEDQHVVLLLSPAAEGFADVHGGDWTDSLDVTEHHWIQLIGLHGTGREIGLIPPKPAFVRWRAHAAAEREERRA